MQHITACKVGDDINNCGLASSKAYNRIKSGTILTGKPHCLWTCQMRSKLHKLHTVSNIKWIRSGTETITACTHTRHHFHLTTSWQFPGTPGIHPFIPSISPDYSRIMPQCYARIFAAPLLVWVIGLLNVVLPVATYNHQFTHSTPCSNTNLRKSRFQQTKKTSWSCLGNWGSRTYN